MREFTRVLRRFAYVPVRLRNTDPDIRFQIVDRGTGYDITCSLFSSREKINLEPTDDRSSYGGDTRGKFLERDRQQRGTESDQNGISSTINPRNRFSWYNDVGFSFYENRRGDNRRTTAIR